MEIPLTQQGGSPLTKQIDPKLQPWCLVGRAPSPARSPQTPPEPVKC